MMDNGRQMDGRQLKGYTISSSCEPNGSGELIKQFQCKTNVTEIMKSKNKTIQSMA